MSLTINVATVNPKEILSPGNTHALSFAHVFRGDMDQTEYVVLQHSAVTESILLFITRTKEAVFGREQRVLS